MNLSKIPLILLAFLMGMFYSYAQVDPAKLPNPNPIIPSSPNAASLGAYGESQVSLYTGQADVTVPLYTIQVKGLSVPISLSYKPSGVKVESVASWVGLEWSLNAGGVITRQLVGMPDESANGYSSNHARQEIAAFMAGGQSEAVSLDYLNRLSTGAVDAEPDVFFFNYPGGVGKFFFGYDGSIQEAPVKKNKIVWVTVNGRTGWKIIDISGNEYYFLDREETAYTSATKAGAQTSIGTTPKSNQTFDSSWYLSQIVVKNTSESIYFDYEGFSYTQRSIGSRSKYIAFDQGCDVPSSGESYTLTTVGALRIKKIRFPGGYVDFVKGASREDLPGDQVLDQVVVKNLNDEVIKSYNLSYHYTTVSSPYGAEYGKRLFLDKVAVSNGVLGNYTFTYNPILLPHRLSYNQDHWGYFNNSDNNDFFTPTDYFYNSSANTYVGVPGANKYIDTVYSQAGVLQKIAYPTGGSTNFVYENNTAYSLPADFDLKWTDKQFFLNGDPSGIETYYEKTFDIDQTFLETGGVFAKLSGNFGCTSSSPGSGTSFSCPDVRLFYPDGSSIQINQQSYGKTFFLKKGRYRITADYTFIADPEIKIQNFSFLLTWPESFKANPLTAHNVKVGGLRIKQIDNYEPNSNHTYTKRYTYTKFNAPNESSGTIVSVPYYKYNVVNYAQGASCDWLCITATSNTGLGTTNGSPVGYAEISEYIDQNGILGKKEYVYISPATVSDQTINKLPFPPADNRDFFRGTLKNEKTYRLKDNEYNLLKEVNNKYGMYNPPGSTYGFGLKAAIYHMYPSNNQSLGDFKWDVYNVVTGWSHLDSTETKTYSDGTVLTEKASYEQNVFNLLNSKTEQINSSGLVNIEIVKYPVDYTDGSYGADQLRNQLSNDVVLEKSAYVNNQLISKEINSYVNFGGLVKQSKMSRLSTTNQVMEDRINFINYDSYGNLLSLRNTEGPKTNYIWSYHNQYPIAEIINAEYATIETVLGGSIDSIALTNPADAEVKALVDQLRNSPLLKNAQITSYTYKPMVGMTSMTDAKGMTTTYEYDAFQRLKNIKDQNGNILKHTDYNYKH
ncbi:RHS repeat domain-containing protein [Pedobacter rhizosphaerae]|uniref:YD repeat-containing protein n=1 Tax=Pedobacter rhizosphaerae TaxID=390241 RepID=A0A1H9W701_9SPHI|nr:RHS repeat domain-containing protein [Pedobacter rhizosphaerae]SES29635.1 YD repeat-containing protein [Pedobacter rhizosphaerae]